MSQNNSDCLKSCLSNRIDSTEHSQTCLTKCIKQCNDNVGSNKRQEQTFPVQENQRNRIILTNTYYGTQSK